MTYLNEDTLVQQTTADYLKDKLGWDSVSAYNQETFGRDGLLGRNSDREVVLTRYLREALKIDFNRLRAEFERAKTKHTTVQSLKSVIEKKLERLIQRNPLRTDFQEH